MFNASIIYFVIPFMSQAFYFLLVRSSLPFPPFFPILSNFLSYPFILTVPSRNWEREREKKRDKKREGVNFTRRSKFACIRERTSPRCDAHNVRASVAHIFDSNKTENNYFESQAHLSFLRPTWHKKQKLVSEEILISTPERNHLL